MITPKKYFISKVPPEKLKKYYIFWPLFCHLATVEFVIFLFVGRRVRTQKCTVESSLEELPLKSQLDSSPRGSKIPHGEELLRLNSSEVKNPASDD